MANHFPVIHRCRCTGVTLFELLATLAVAAILASFAAPAVGDLLRDNRMTATVNGFLLDLRLARSEAVKRRHKVALCPTAGNRLCDDGGAWDGGWLLFVDENGDGTRSDREPLLRQHAAAQSHITIDGGRRNRIMFYPNGRSPGSNGTFVFCDPHADGNNRRVILSNTGRARVIRDPAGSNCPQ